MSHEHGPAKPAGIFAELVVELGRVVRRFHDENTAEKQTTYFGRPAVAVRITHRRAARMAALVDRATKAPAESRTGFRVADAVADTPQRAAFVCGKLIASDEWFEYTPQGDGTYRFLVRAEAAELLGRFLVESVRFCPQPPR